MGISQSTYDSPHMEQFGDGAIYLLWLLRDEFTLAAGAPLASPRTCEPGPGQLTLVQTDGQFSVVNGQLVIPEQATPTYGDLGFYGGAFVRQLGRTLVCEITPTGGTA